MLREDSDKPFKEFTLNMDIAETISPLIGFYIYNKRLPNYDEVSQG